MTETTPAPPEGMKALDRLVGTWKISGGQGEGETTYEWMDGGFFLIQRGRLEQEQGPMSYLQIIGYERGSDGQSADEITGRLYTSRGDTLRYTCEADGDALTIWFGPKGSPSVYRARFSEDGNTLTGRWDWPGGGYDETMTRVTG